MPNKQIIHDINCDTENLIKTIAKTNTSLTSNNNELIHWILYIYEKCGLSTIKEVLLHTNIKLNDMYTLVENQKLSVLWSAYSKKYTDLVKLLLELNANPTQDDGFTVLHWMASMNDIDMLYQIKNKHFNINKKDYENDIKDRTPLHWAAQENSIDATNFLLEKGADIDETEIDGRTALHLASSEGNEEIVTMLIKEDANPHIMDNFGNTALDLAQAYNHTSIEKILLKPTL